MVHGGKTKKVILVVDDEYVTHHLISVILNDGDYKILSAYNGLEALEQLARWPVDMILSDLNMPYMDGLTLIERVRADKRYCNLPVVIITASPVSNMPQEALEKGATAFISQPFSSWEIIRAVTECLPETRPASYTRFDREKPAA